MDKVPFHGLLQRPHAPNIFCPVFEIYFVEKKKKKKRRKKKKRYLFVNRDICISGVPQGHGISEISMFRKFGIIKHNFRILKSRFLCIGYLKEIILGYGIFPTRPLTSLYFRIFRDTGCRPFFYLGLNAIFENSKDSGNFGIWGIKHYCGILKKWGCGIFQVIRLDTGYSYSHLQNHEYCWVCYRALERYLSRRMIKPTKWHVRPAKTQIRSAWTSAQSDQSLHCAHNR